MTISQDRESTPPDGDSLAAQSFARIADEARKLGFEYCCHGLRIPLPITRPRTVFLCNYAPEWERIYHERGYINIDPTIAHGMRSSEPVVWTDEFFAAVPEFWREAQSYGLRYGWAQSRRDSEGTYSLLVLARSTQAIDAKELAEKEQRMQWLVHASHRAIKTACTDPEITRAPTELTEREIEVLRWTAEGKTSADIAEFMRLSERTVNFHVNSAVEKLGASNKTSAAVRAAMLGLIW